MTELPQATFYIVGFLILSNLGVILSLVIWGGKAVWWASRVNQEIKELTKDMDYAHTNIRKNREAIKDLEINTNP